MLINKNKLATIASFILFGRSYRKKKYIPISTLQWSLNKKKIHKKTIVYNIV